MGRLIAQPVQHEKYKVQARSVDGNSVEMFKKIQEIDGFLIGGASKSSKKLIDVIKNYYR